MHIRLRSAVIAGMLSLALMLAATPAFAHAVLLGSEPADGGRVETPPPEVTLRFSEPVSPMAVQVIGPGGARIAAPAAVAAGDVVRVPLPGTLPHGSYVLSYRVTSVDGHPVAGSVVFGIGEAAAAGQGSPAPADQELAGLAAATRTVHFGTLLASTGGVMFLLAVLGTCHPLSGRIRRGVLVLTGIAAATLILAAGISGLQLTGLAPTALWSDAPWAAAAETTLRGSVAAGLAGLALIAFGLLSKRVVIARAAMSAGCLLAISSLALTGHAATAPPRALSAPLVYLHGLAGAFWVGSLWPLWTVLRHAPAPESTVVVKRFSTIAIAAVVLLVAAGAALSVIQLDADPGAVLRTAYGWVWASKIALVVLLLGLAVVNRRILTPRLASKGGAALRRSITAELALVAGIVAATALLSQTPPPRALSMREHVEHAEHAHGHHHAPAPVSVALQERGYLARLAIDPARAGRNGIRLAVENKEGQPVTPREVTAILALPEAGIEPFARPLAATGQGEFAGEVELLVSGKWSVTIEALVTDFDKVTFGGTVTIAD